MKKRAFLLSVFVCLLFVSGVLAQTASPLLEEGIRQYQDENYEEAIEILEKASLEDPPSALAAYFLGMAYKQTMDYARALIHLEKALKLKPAVKEALVEYVSLLYRQDKLAEARKWIDVGKKENIDPANLFFLEGLILMKEKKPKKAIASFEKAKSLDPKLAQSADYQIGLCYMQDRKYKQAKERFRATVAYDSTTDLAAYARHYQEIAENSQFYTRPLRLTLGLQGGYDSNVITKPKEDALSGDSRDPATGMLSPLLRVEYVPRFETSWLLYAMYSHGQTLHQRFTHARDSLVDSVAVMPGYNFGRVSVSLMGAYTNYLMKTDPDPVPDENAGLKRYLDYFTVGPVVRWMVSPAHIAEGFAGYDKKNYYNQPMLSENNNRDNEGYRAYLSWSWFYMDNGLLNVRYDITREAANGAYWDALSHRLSGSLIVPLFPEDIARKIGRLSLQLTGGATFAFYSYAQPYLDKDLSSRIDKRKDVVYTGSAGLNWEVFKNLNLLLEYTRTEAVSNFPVYEYNRNVYLAGLELRF